ncbi:hypothetical protein [Gemmatimonas sp.]|uniref:hypothetical protein n=1 Tax=Gemmatimonas sp. TaxID=1962908 RepID=UPI0025C51121|nr:hypothetical protein [Gemmatimonas sp.]MCA2991099.1 hypothetical protein [Gemmatimonas sp.]
MIPSIIAQHEMQFFDDLGGKRIYLECVPASVTGKYTFRERQGWAPEASAPTAASSPAFAGEFTVWEAPAAEFLRTGELLHPDLAPKVDDGEREAVTYLRLADEEDRLWFATADAGAIQAVVAFGRSDWAVSFEHVLKTCGQLTALDPEFCDMHVSKCKKIGGERLAQGRALAVPQVAKKGKKR